MRLERIALIRLPPSIKAFQFHKGAIRTLLHRRLYGGRRAFQFHKGAIRTEEARQAAEEARNFNSIKVRLEPPSWVVGDGSGSISIP